MYLGIWALTKAWFCPRRWQQGKRSTSFFESLRQTTRIHCCLFASVVLPWQLQYGLIGWCQYRYTAAIIYCIINVMHHVVSWCSVYVIYVWYRMITYVYPYDTVNIFITINYNDTIHYMLCSPMYFVSDMIWYCTSWHLGGLLNAFKQSTLFSHFR